MYRHKPTYPGLLELGGTGRTASIMDVKRIFRGPLFWIVVAFLGVLVIGQLLTGSTGYKSEPTPARSCRLIQQATARRRSSPSR